MKTPSPFSRLSRALFATRLVMMWERFVPVVAPFLLWVGLIGVAALWGLFKGLDPLVHLAILSAGFVLAGVASVRALLRFRIPDFVELHQRLGVDNGMRADQVLGFRHRREQPRFRIGRPKAGFAQADPMALRFMALAGLVLGLLIHGPVPLSQIASAYCPFAPQLLAHLVP